MSGGKFEEWNVCRLPPTVNGATLTPKLPYGERATALTTVPVEQALHDDLYKQMPDGAGNAAGVDMTERVLVEFFADSCDVCILFGAAGAGLTPDPAATNASTPANVCAVIPQNTSVRWWLSPKTERSFYARSRATTGTVRYAVIGSLSGGR